MLARNRKLGMWEFVIGFVLGLVAAWIYSLFTKQRAKAPAAFEANAGSQEKLAPIQLPEEIEESIAGLETVTAPVSSEEATPDENNGALSVVPDDLKKINGIGPKISGLLEQAGIVTFEQVANAKLDVLEGILEKAGPRFRLADPDDWAKQARNLMQ